MNTWNPKQPFTNGCLNWMIPNLYIENGCFTKHPFIFGCLGFQVYIRHHLSRSQCNYCTYFDMEHVSFLFWGTEDPLFVKVVG